VVQLANHVTTPRSSGSASAPAPGEEVFSRGLTARTIATAALATSVGVLPPFLLGAMSFQVRPEFGFSEQALGAAIAAFFAMSALSSVPSGRLAERVGGRHAVYLAAVATAVSLLGAGVLAQAWWHLVAFLAIGGVGMALSATASSLSVARLIVPSRQGLAFGISKSAGPAATMLAGFAVPIVALTIGWRWAFGIGGVAALIVFLIAPDDVAAHRRRGVQRFDLPDASRLALVVLAVSVGFGIGAANSMGAFFIESALARGFDPGFAGVALAIGSLSGMLGRILWGWIADRRTSGRLHMVAILMAVGGLAMLSLTVVDTRLTLLVVGMVAFAAAWGWTGLLIYVVVRVAPRAPAAASGVTSAGMFTGATAGPLIFGAAAQRGSYVVMWAVGASAMLLASVFAELTLVLIKRERRSHA
jgi:MFS family permease